LTVLRVLELDSQSLNSLYGKERPVHSLAFLLLCFTKKGEIMTELLLFADVLTGSPKMPFAPGGPVRP